MTLQVETRFVKLINEIRAQRGALDTLAQRLRTQEILDAFNPYDHKSWCLAVMGDALVRLRLFTEQNFNFVETMGTVAVARYIFELSVWLKLFELDARYGLVYHAQLIETQRLYWSDYCNQLGREVTLLKRLEQREKQLRDKEMKRVNQITNPEEKKQALLTLWKDISTDIDAEASRHFSIFADQAKKNGYGFQAYLVEQEVIPQIKASLSAVDQEQAKFDDNTSQDVKDMIPERWNWSRMAKKVELSDEYEFIYTFASKLLHATPASITTDQKNLEMPELLIFLKYINIKIVDIIELARRYPK